MEIPRLLPATTEDDPLLLAKPLTRVLEDRLLRHEVVCRGRAGLRDFDPTLAWASPLEPLASVV